MLSRAHNKFGTTGLIVAIMALIAALGGTAIAASKLNATQKQEVKKIAQKYAGKPGAPGPQGPAGASGKDGTNGTNGAPGADGKSVAIGAAGGNCPTPNGTSLEVEGSGVKRYVCNGENGQTGFTETLPSGKTETGTWATPTYPDKEEFTEERVAISFNIPLSAAPTIVYVEPGKTEPGCPGSVSNPEADAEKLCVYAQYQHEVGFGFAALTGSAGAVLIFAALKPEAGAYGSWAVTAP